MIVVELVTAIVVAGIITTLCARYVNARRRLARRHGPTLRPEDYPRDFTVIVAPFIGGTKR